MHNTERQLRRFVDFMRRHRASFITTALALQWATKSTKCHPGNWRNRLIVVRCFARFRFASDPRTEIPPPGLLPQRYRRTTRSIPTDDDVSRLLEAAKRVRAPKRLWGATHVTILGLLAVAAIRSFFRYVALCEPAMGGLAQRILLLPKKRYDRKPVDFLTPRETAALLAAPRRGTWTGRRDYALMLVAVQTGLRVSELVKLCWGSVALGVGAYVKCSGKGRKERCTPLFKEAAAMLRAWSRECKSDAQSPVFPNARGACLSRDGVQYIVAKHAATARRQCLSLKGKRVSPHVLRHTSAMNLLQHGIDRSVIALWLGHESSETTDVYLHANLEMKERALARTAPSNVKPGRYKPSDKVLSFLKSL